MRWVARALLALSVRPGGFTTSQLAQHVRGQTSGLDSPHAEHGDCDRATVFGPLACLQADEIAAERNPDCRERATDDEGATIRQMSVAMPKSVRTGAYIEQCGAWKQERYPDPIHPEDMNPWAGPKSFRVQVYSPPGPGYFDIRAATATAKGAPNKRPERSHKIMFPEP